jgi:hypothetical protein
MIEYGLQRCSPIEPVFCLMVIVNMVVGSLVYLYGHLTGAVYCVYDCLLCPIEDKCKIALRVPPTIRRLDRYTSTAGTCTSTGSCAKLYEADRRGLRELRELPGG